MRNVAVEIQLHKDHVARMVNALRRQIDVMLQHVDTIEESTAELWLESEREFERIASEKTRL